MPISDLTGSGGIYFGNSLIQNIFVGNNYVSKIYIGNSLIYEKEIAYSITPSVTNGTYSGDISIIKGGTATVTITADTGYTLPASITVTGASYTYSSSTGVISLSNPTDNVTISAVCEAAVVAGDYITFESDDGTEFTLGTDAEYAGMSSGYIFGNDGTLEYSTDAVTWQTFDPYTPITSSNGKIYMRGTGNTTLSTYSSCFLEGTQITLADGSKKNIEDITYDDKLKVWDFDNGCYAEAPICWLTKTGLRNNHYYKLTFSDGNILKTTGRNSNHKVYNVDEHYFKGVNKTEIGDRIFSENGIVTVVNKEYIEEIIPYYNLITSLNFDCFANGILTSDRYGNIYPIDENMKFIKDGREVRPYDEFEEVNIKRYWYDNLRLGENTETIEETKKYISRLESQMREVK